MGFSPHHASSYFLLGTLWIVLCICAEFTVALQASVVWEGHTALLETVFHLYADFVSVAVLLFRLSTVLSQFLIILWPFLVLVLKC